MYTNNTVAGSRDCLKNMMFLFPMVPPEELSREYRIQTKIFTYTNYLKFLYPEYV